VWSENSPKTLPELLVFPDAEDTIWEYDEQANAYYLHHLYQYSGQFLERYYKLTRGKEHKKVELNVSQGWS
jgi:hypothetical protein